MRKKILEIVGLVVAICLMAGCQSDTYSIIGEAFHLPDGSMLYLTTSLDGQGEVLDSAIVERGRFRCQGHIDEPQISRLYLSTDSQQSIVFFNEPGNIYIELSEQPGQSRVSGTTINNRWQTLNDSVAKYELRIRSIVESASDSINPHQRFVDVERQYASLTRLIKETALRNKENALGLFINNHYQGD